MQRPRWPISGEVPLGIADRAVEHSKDGVAETGVHTASVHVPSRDRDPDLLHPFRAVDVDANVNALGQDPGDFDGGLSTCVLQVGFIDPRCTAPCRSRATRSRSFARAESPWEVSRVELAWLRCFRHQVEWSSLSAGAIAGRKAAI